MSLSIEERIPEFLRVRPEKYLNTGPEISFEVLVLLSASELTFVALEAVIE